MSTITRRPILGEDIGFDIDGDGSTYDFTMPDGTSKTGHKLNASHLPVTEALRIKTLQNNVDDAIDAVWDKADLGSNIASLSQYGRTIYASDSETQAGTIDTKATTPKGIASLTSSTTRRGLIETATTAEAEAGTDTERAVTPAGAKAVIEKVANDNKWGFTIERCPTGEWLINDTYITLSSPAVMYDDTFQYYFSLNNSISKQLTAYWSEGDMQGGIAVGAFSVRLTYVHVFLIYNTVTKAIDMIFDNNENGDNINATVGDNWVKRRITVVRCDNTTDSDIATGHVYRQGGLNNGVTYSNFQEEFGNFKTSSWSTIYFHDTVGVKCAFVSGVITSEGSLAASDYIRVFAYRHIGAQISLSELCACGDNYARIPFTTHYCLNGSIEYQLEGALSESKTFRIYITAIDVFNYRGI